MTNWPTAALGELVQFYSGGTPSKADASLWGGAVPWVSAKDVKRSRLTGSIDHLTEAAFAKGSLRKLPIGTVVMVVRGMILAHTVPIATLGVEAAINQDLKALIPRAPIEPSFLAAMLQAQHGDLLAKVSTAAHGTKKLDSRVLEEVRVPLPPIEEQRRIAAILDHVDSLQRQCRLALRNLTTLSQVVFPSELTASWPRLALRDACLNDGDYGANVPSTEMAPGRPRYIRITDIDEHGGLNRDERAPAGRAADWERYVVQPGDVLFARSGATVGKTYLQPEHGPDAVFAGYLIRFQTNPEVLDPVYLAGYTHTSEYRSWVAARQNVVAQPNINAKQYGNELLVPIPPLGIQHDYRRLVEAIEGRRVVMRQREALLARLSDSLRARAFSGRL